MSSPGPVTLLRTVAFGDVDAGLWGLVVGESLLVAFVELAAARANLAPATLTGAGEHEPWRLRGAAGELVVAPIGVVVPTTPPEEREAGFDQLCRVTGHASVEGRRIEIECLGRRGVRPRLDERRFDSVRDVSAWFDEDDALAVTALRPRRATGHGHDLLTATVFEREGPAPVVEARLSTTYTTGGRQPARVGIELWIGKEDGDQYPRRVAGEAVGPRITGAANGLELEAALLRCHSRNRGGTGIYVLGRPGSP